MESLIILLPLALAMIALAMAVLLWAVDDGQFDDLEGPAHSILFDEPSTPGRTEANNAQGKSQK